MPNWCDNKVRIEGPVDKIYDMAKAVEEERLLEYMVPVEGTNMDRSNAWGTKWDIKHDHGLQFNKDKNYSEINGYFESAWSPPTEAVRTWLQKNPDCDADLLYCEFSNDFMGTLDDEYEISSTPVSWFLGDETGIALDEAFDIIGMKEELLEEEYEEILNEPLTLLNPEKEV